MSRSSPWATLPTALPTGTLLPHASARLRHEVADAVFYASGGAERLLAHVEKSDENYQWFIEKVWAKGLPRITNAELTVDAEGIEGFIARLDAGEHATVVNQKPAPNTHHADDVLDMEPAE